MSGQKYPGITRVSVASTLQPKPVKLVARGMGFNDEFYFSRHFKKHVGVSPLVFRNTAGFNKGGS